MPQSLLIPTYLIFNDNFIFANFAIGALIALPLVIYNAKKVKLIYCYDEYLEVVDYLLIHKKIRYEDIESVVRGIYSYRGGKIESYDGECFSINKKMTSLASLIRHISLPIYYCDEYDELLNIIKSHNSEVKFPCGSIVLGEIVTVTVDRPMGSFHPEHKDLYYPINYGFVKGIFANDGEEQDAYILGVDKAVPNFTGMVIAIIKRKNDNEDKWVVAPENMSFTKEEIIEQTKFQEQYFDIEVIM